LQAGVSRAKVTSFGVIRQIPGYSGIFRDKVFFGDLDHTGREGRDGGLPRLEIRLHQTKSNRIKPVDIETDQTGNRSAQIGAPVAKSIFAKRTQNSVPNQALIKIGPTN
jgi:hypothetical protein